MDQTEESAAAAQPPRQRRRRQTREQLRGTVVEVATRLFAERGYGALTIREIAQEAELALTVLYRFFIDKRDLYVQCCLEAVDRDIESLGGALSDTDDPERIIFDFTLGLFRRRMDAHVPHIVTRAIFDGDLDIIEERMSVLFNAPFFQRTLAASSALIPDTFGSSRLLYIYALAFGLPRLMPLWVRHIDDFAGDESEQATAVRVLGMIYPGRDWTRHLADR